MKRQYMFLRLLILAVTFILPLCAAPENKKGTSIGEMFTDINGCVGCNDCRQKPSAAELLNAIQIVLNSEILLLPQLQTQLTE